jgi:hypothetical protein
MTTLSPRFSTHDKRRSKLRGIPRSRRQLLHAADLIAAGSKLAIFKYRPKRGNPVYAVPHCGRFRPVVYAPGTGTIVSVLPDSDLPPMVYAALPRRPA